VKCTGNLFCGCRLSLGQRAEAIVTTAFFERSPPLQSLFFSSSSNAIQMEFPRDFLKKVSLLQLLAERSCQRLTTIQPFRPATIGPCPHLQTTCLPRLLKRSLCQAMPTAQRVCVQTGTDPNTSVPLCRRQQVSGFSLPSSHSPYRTAHGLTVAFIWGSCRPSSTGCEDERVFCTKRIAFQ
jgi:hypothetical protein